MKKSPNKQRRKSVENDESEVSEDKDYNFEDLNDYDENYDE